MGTLLADEGKAETLRDASQSSAADVSASASIGVDVPPGLNAEKFELSPQQAEDLINDLLDKEVPIDKALPHIRVDHVFGIGDQEAPPSEKGFTWKRMRVTMDSGSHVDVMPEEELPHSSRAASRRP